MRSYYVSDAILSTEDALVNQTDKVPAFMESVIKIQGSKQTRQLQTIENAKKGKKLNKRVTGEAQF